MVSDERNEKTIFRRNVKTIRNNNQAIRFLARQDRIQKEKRFARPGNRVYHIGTNQNAKIEGFEMKIIKHKEDLPTPCKTCRKLRQTVRIPVYHCGLKMHFPTKKNTCKREDMNTVGLFKKFLRDNGIYEKYCRNFDVEYLGNNGKIKGADNFINEAFVWVDTKEGHSFWRAMKDKWENILKQRG